MPSISNNMVYAHIPHLFYASYNKEMTGGYGVKTSIVPLLATMYVTKHDIISDGYF